LRRDTFANAVRHLNGAGQRRLRQNYGKLLTPIARGEIDFTASVTNRLGNSADNHVSARMAAPVIYLLEEIKVDDEQRERMVVPLGPAQFNGQSRLEEPMIRQSGQEIGPRPVLYFLE